MAGEVAHVESPEDGPLDLCSQLASRLVEVGVDPQVAERAGEAAVTVEQRRSVGDRAPPVGVVLGVEGEVDPDVFAPVAGRRVPSPGAGDHERGAGGDPAAQGPVGAEVGGVARAEVVEVDTKEERLGAGTTALGEGG